MNATPLLPVMSSSLHEKGALVFGLMILPFLDFCPNFVVPVLASLDVVPLVLALWMVKSRSGQVNVVLVGVVDRVYV